MVLLIWIKCFLQWVRELLTHHNPRIFQLVEKQIFIYSVNILMEILILLTSKLSFYFKKKLTFYGILCIDKYIIIWFFVLVQYTLQNWLWIFNHILKYIWFYVVLLFRRCNYNYVFRKNRSLFADLLKSSPDHPWKH